MATAKKSDEETVVKKEHPETMTIHLRRGKQNEENFITASLNGKMYKIMKGVDVEVPYGIWLILESSRVQEESLYDYIDSKTNIED